MIANLTVSPESTNIEEFGGKVVRSFTSWRIDWLECKNDQARCLERRALHYSDIPGVLQEIYRNE